MLGDKISFVFSIQNKRRRKSKCQRKDTLFREIIKKKKNNTRTENTIFPNNIYLNYSVRTVSAMPFISFSASDSIYRYVFGILNVVSIFK